MRVRYFISLFGALALVMTVPAAAAPAMGAAPSHPLTVSIIGAPEIQGSGSALVAKRLRSAGISRVTLFLNWSEVVPSQEPRNWTAANPRDSHYDWSGPDARVKAAVKAGLQPMLLLVGPPVWGRLYPTLSASPPQPAKWGQFARAVAEHYGGSFSGVPRVRYWQIWNEPNIFLFLWPQFDAKTKQFTSPDAYRDIVNAAAGSIHAVHSDNVVVAGETAPFRDTSPEVQALDKDWGPLKFMRRLLCIDDKGRPTCDKSVSFDVWSTHPYTSGGPTHKAALPYDVSLGNLPQMRAALQAGVRAGHVKSSRPPRFWVTEFSWDSNPPDHCAVPLSLLKRWVPEVLYRVWAADIDLFGWFQFMDDPLDKSYFQSGLVYRAASVSAARPKPFLEGLRFPFVSLKRGNRTYVWAHTPFGKPARIRVQQSLRGGWKNVATLRSDRFGIVQAVLGARPLGQFRAVLPRGEKSLPFSMHVPPDRFFNPFGQASTLEPNGKACTP
jgi:hypothetical protein